MHTDLIDTLLWRALAIFLLFGALSGIALGLLLVFWPQLLERVNRVANRWVSTRHMDQLLDRSISIEGWFYQHHRALGGLLVCGAAYVLIYFGFLFDKAPTLQRYSQAVPAQLLDGLLDALVLAALTGATVALLAGLFLALRPSMLRGIEEVSNQWVSSRRATKVLAVPHDQVERFVARHVRRVGWLLLLGSIYLALILLRVLV